MVFWGGTDILFVRTGRMPVPPMILPFFMAARLSQQRRNAVINYFDSVLFHRILSNYLFLICTIKNFLPQDFDELIGQVLKTTTYRRQLKP